MLEEGRLTGPPAVLSALVERFDPTAFDAPAGRARIRLIVTGEGEWDVVVARGVSLDVPGRPAPDATISADLATWDRIARDLRGGMDAYRAGQLVVRHDLHLGVGFLAATSGATGPARLRFERIHTRSGAIAALTAGVGEPVLMLHGLGGTKGSFLPTVAALAGTFRTIAIDLPGFGDSYKPLAGRYHPPFFARAVVAVMDALELPRAHVIGNSMGGRIALELGLRHPARVGRLVMLAPSLACASVGTWIRRTTRRPLGGARSWPATTTSSRVTQTGSRRCSRSCCPRRVRVTSAR